MSFKILVTLLATTIFILFVWFTSDLHFLSTEAGIALTIIAIFLAIINSTTVVFSIKADYLLVDNQNYLNQMLWLKRQQEFTSKKIMRLYYILLVAGLALYMFEPASKMTATGMLLAYIVTFTWITIAWFYLRPRAVKKQKAKMNEIVESFNICAIERLSVNFYSGTLTRVVN